MSGVNKSKKIWGLILLVSAFLILSIVMPFLQSQTTKYDYKFEQSARLLLQVAILSSTAKMETSISNIISLLTSPNSREANEAIKYLRDSAKKEKVKKLVLLHSAFYDSVPSKEQLSYWNSKSLTELEDMEYTMWDNKSTWDVEAKETIHKLRILMYILYAIALICQGFGLFMVNLR